MQQFNSKCWQYSLFFVVVLLLAIFQYSYVITSSLSCLVFAPKFTSHVHCRQTVIRRKLPFLSSRNGHSAESSQPSRYKKQPLFLLHGWVQIQSVNIGEKIQKSAGKTSGVCVFLLPKFDRSLIFEFFFSRRYANFDFDLGS